MTPSARLQAAIEALTEIRSGPAPADAVLANYFKSRRYIGSKDRGAIAETVYAALRAYARTGWQIEQAGGAPTPRLRVLGLPILAEGATADQMSRMCGGGAYHPEPLNAATELPILRRLEGRKLDHPSMPERVRAECPDWAEDSLRAVFGDGFMRELAALNQPAPLDLRINVMMADRDAARRALAEEGIDAEPTPLSPLGLRVHGRPPLSATQVFKNGWVEVQDEGSQILALLVGAKPGMQVVDFCAGAGGKTLAIAAGMANKGRVVAMDISAKRLDRAGQRLRRAGLHNVERRPLASTRDPWVKRHKGKFDRVLVDAPCSGVGTWRRNPDAKWGRGGPDLEELVALQREILDSAARLVKPGGRLIYATCSLLPQEDEGQIEAFLADHPEFAPLPASSLWPEISTAPAPNSDPYLRLTPARHGADGFFAAILERKPAPEAAKETP